MNAIFNQVLAKIEHEEEGNGNALRALVARIATTLEDNEETRKLVRTFVTSVHGQETLKQLAAGVATTGAGASKQEEEEGGDGGGDEKDEGLVWFLNHADAVWCLGRVFGGVVVSDVLTNHCQRLDLTATRPLDHVFAPSEPVTVILTPKDSTKRVHRVCSAPLTNSVFVLTHLPIWHFKVDAASPYSPDSPYVTHAANRAVELVASAPPCEGDVVEVYIRVMEGQCPAGGWVRGVMRKDDGGALTLALTPPHFVCVESITSGNTNMLWRERVIRLEHKVLAMCRVVRRAAEDCGEKAAATMAPLVPLPLVPGSLVFHTPTQQLRTVLCVCRDDEGKARSVVLKLTKKGAGNPLFNVVPVVDVQPTMYEYASVAATPVNPEGGEGPKYA